MVRRKAGDIEESMLGLTDDDKAEIGAGFVAIDCDKSGGISAAEILNAAEKTNCEADPTDVDVCSD